MKRLYPLYLSFLLAGILPACSDTAQVSNPGADTPAPASVPAASLSDTAASHPHSAHAGPAPVLRPGRHQLTLQWIGWNNPGMARITPSESGWYNIEGEQRGNDGDYLRVSGGLRVVSAKELFFRGRIETRVARLNGGQPCIKDGEQRFLATRGRQYWRLQNMHTCGEKNTVDYVDLYFK